MISIVEMTFKDFEEIKDILQTDFDEFWSQNILKSELESELSKYFVAKKDGKIVGFAGVIILPDDVEITNIVTKKNERKRGIGKLLLDKLIQIAFELQKDISLEVNEKNESAINLYKKAEFKEVGIRKKYYNGCENAIIMTKKFTI